MWAVGYHSDMSRYGKRAHLTATTHHWGQYYTAVAKAVLGGERSSRDTWGGIKEGFIELAPFGDAVPEDVRALVAAKEREIAEGKLHPFAGPVKDQSGAIVVPAGETLSDKALLTMDFYVVGKLPE